MIPSNWRPTLLPISTLILGIRRCAVWQSLQVEGTSVSFFFFLAVNLTGLPCLKPDNSWKGHLWRYSTYINRQLELENAFLSSVADWLHISAAETHRSGVFQGSFNSNSIPVTIYRPDSISGVAVASQAAQFQSRGTVIGYLTMVQLIFPVFLDRHFRICRLNQSVNFNFTTKGHLALNWSENNPVSCCLKALRNPWTELR